MMKKDLILLHGALGSSKSFDRLATHLSENYNLIIPDLKWHGERSAEGQAFTMSELADDFDLFLQKEDFKSSLVFGFSMGGYVALSLALKKPQLFEKIMTLGTKLDWKPEQALKETKMLNPDLIEQKVPKYANQLENLHGRNWKQLCQQTKNMMIDLGQSPLLNEENVKKLDMPVRLCLGDRDNMVSLNETYAFYKALGEGQLQVFPNCLHPIEKVDAKMLSAAISSFF